MSSTRKDRVKAARRWVRLFMRRFVPGLERGEKLQTVRPRPKRMPVVGDVIECRYWEGRPYWSKQLWAAEGVLTRVCRCRITAEDVSLAPLVLSGREERPGCCLTQEGLECIGDGHGGCGWHGCESGSVEKGCEYILKGGMVTGYRLTEESEDSVWLCPACGGECAHTPMDEWEDLRVPGCRCGSEFPDKEVFARADGFASWEEMRGWFEGQHGLPFEGVLLQWRLRTADEIEGGHAHG